MILHWKIILYSFDRSLRVESSSKIIRSNALYFRYFSTLVITSAMNLQWFCWEANRDNDVNDISAKTIVNSLQKSDH